MKINQLIAEFNETGDISGLICSVQYCWQKQGPLTVGNSAHQEIIEPILPSVSTGTLQNAQKPTSGEQQCRKWPWDRVLHRAVLLVFIVSSRTCQLAVTLRPGIVCVHVYMERLLEYFKEKLLTFWLHFSPTILIFGHLI